MLTIRFARVGKKNRAQFQIVLQEHTVAPGGRHVEVLGSYDPHLKKASIKEDRVKYWIEKGAQMSDTAHNLFVSKGVISGEKRKVKVPKKKGEEKKEGVGDTAEKEDNDKQKEEKVKSENKQAEKKEEETKE